MDTRQTKNWDKTTYNKIEIKIFVDLSALKVKLVFQCNEKVANLCSYYLLFMLYTSFIRVVLGPFVAAKLTYIFT